MLAMNILWKPVRLEIERQGPNRFLVSRNDEPKGTIFFTKKHGWELHRHLNTRCILKTQSFRTGVLYLCRRALYVGSAQDFGLMQVNRYDISGVWFTILTDPQKNHHTQVFLDFPQELRAPTERMQAILHKALNAVRNKK